MFWFRQFVTGVFLFAAQDHYTLKIDVPVVSVDVAVSDAKDSLVNDLTKSDFQIFEEVAIQFRLPSRLSGFPKRSACIKNKEVEPQNRTLSH